jgi:hypothetical protein
MMGSSGVESIIRMARLIILTSLLKRINSLPFGCLIVDKLKVNVDQKAFSMKVDELFDVITNIVAHPHTAIVKHDRERAAKIFLALQDYVYNHTECWENTGCFVSEPALDFDTYLEGIFDEDEIYEIHNM